ncbi:hypothetical protein HUG17_5749 [Dermatophagoides farinae]|uniref:Uncharacterized protein n=1 Tax=Dermatophagoides farinae TaxID=6954 RepID=A0A9D4P312_DERFA|nr:hypothetical protein HUG17_5749 [Dermatophagoides farinae]
MPQLSTMMNKHDSLSYSSPLYLDIDHHHDHHSNPISTTIFKLENMDKLHQHQHHHSTKIKPIIDSILGFAATNTDNNNNNSNNNKSIDNSAVDFIYGHRHQNQYQQQQQQQQQTILSVQQQSNHQNSFYPNPMKINSIELN